MDYLFISISAAFSCAAAFAVISKKWYRLLPVLSAYVLVLAPISLLILTTYVGQQTPNRFQRTFSRIYYISYFIDSVLISIFSIAILFEFLFLMAGGRKNIQKTATAGCLITVGLSLTAALQLGRTPEHFAEVFWRTTSLSLIAVCLVILIMKAVFSFRLQKNLVVLLVVIAVCPFVEEMSGYLKSNAGEFLSQLTWPMFTLMLYAVLRKGPAGRLQLPV